MKQTPEKKEQSGWWLALRARLPGQVKGFFGKIGRRLKGAALACGRWFKASFALPKGEAGSLLVRGLFLRDPIAAVPAVLCAVLPVTARLDRGVAAAVAALAVLLLADLIIALVGKRLTVPLRGLCRAAAVVLLGCGAAALTALWFPGLAEGLELAMAVLAAAALFAAYADGSTDGPAAGRAVMTALGRGLGFGWVVILTACLRELLGAGALWGAPLFGGAVPVLLLAAPCGGLFLLALGAAARNLLRRLGKKGGETQ